MSAAAEMQLQQADDLASEFASNRLEAPPQHELYAPSGVLWQAYMRWRPEIEQAIDPRFYPMRWLDDRVWHGSAMFDYTPTACVLTEWKQYPTGALQIEGLVCAGDLSSVVEDIRPVLEQRGRDHGALYLLVESRPGWSRALLNEGYETHQVAVRKPLAPFASMR